MLHDYNVFLDCIAYASQVKLPVLLSFSSVFVRFCSIFHIRILKAHVPISRPPLGLRITSIAPGNYPFRWFVWLMFIDDDAFISVTLDVRAKFGPLTPDVAPGT